MAEKNHKREILVYADWETVTGPVLMGTLAATPIRGKEVFLFEYSKEWIQRGFSQMLDPDLQLFTGRQFLREEKTNFGVFLDSSPDRWGRLLMNRREAIISKAENRKALPLFESDYLLGVFDGQRMGARVTLTSII